MSFGVEQFRGFQISPPHVLAQTDHMLVMERLAGMPMYRQEELLDPPKLRQLYFRFGEAVAKLVSEASRGGGIVDLEKVFRAAGD